MFNSKHVHYNLLSMRKLHLLILTLLCVSSFSFTQSIERNVLGSSGQVLTNGNLELSYTIGEVIVTQLNQSQYIITQGFHQPSKKKLVDEGVADILIYPNPTVDQIVIQFPNDVGDYKINVFDETGRLIKKISSNELQQIISLKEEAAAAYYFRIEGEDFKSTYTIVKVN